MQQRTQQAALRQACEAEGRLAAARDCNCVTSQQAAHTAAQPCCWIQRRGQIHTGDRILRTCIHCR